MPTTLNIKPDLIHWAISRAGYEPGVFYDLFPKAKDWVEGGKKPTFAQLRDFAKKAHVPFGYLMLQEPPAEQLPIPLYRTLDGPTKNISVNLRDTILSIQKRQDWVREYLLEEGSEPLSFAGAFSISDSVERIVENMRATLDLDTLWARDLKNWEEAHKHLTQKVQDAGIFVVFNSVVDNNTHRPIKVKECRGFVLADTIAPFMFINAADTKAAQMFTIVHELAHLWIGESAAFDMHQLKASNNETERFCDEVAAEFLVPARDLHEQWRINHDFTKLARVFKVSPIVIGRRAMDEGLIERDAFFEFYDAYMEGFFKRKEHASGGGDFFATSSRRLNPRFLELVHQAVRDNKLLHKRAYELTALKGSTYHQAIEKMGL